LSVDNISSFKISSVYRGVEERVIDNPFQVVETWRHLNSSCYIYPRRLGGCLKCSLCHIEFIHSFEETVWWRLDSNQGWWPMAYA